MLLQLVIDHTDRGSERASWRAEPVRDTSIEICVRRACWSCTLDPDHLPTLVSFGKIALTASVSG